MAVPSRSATHSRKGFSWIVIHSSLCGFSIECDLQGLSELRFLARPEPRATISGLFGLARGQLGTSLLELSAHFSA
jgi:hypothetical protein